MRRCEGYVRALVFAAVACIHQGVRRTYEDGSTIGVSQAGHQEVDISLRDADLVALLGGGRGFGHDCDCFDGLEGSLGVRGGEERLKSVRGGVGQSGRYFVRKRVLSARPSV